MFITKKITKRTVAVAIIIAALLTMIILRFSACGFTKATAQSQTLGTYSLLAGDNESCINFLSQFELSVQEEPVEVTKVKIPAEFNKTFEDYNELQKQQGLDLSYYKGKECQRRSYKILNYGTDEEVLANILVYNGIVIGGDVCSVALDGFMTTFDSQTMG